MKYYFSKLQKHAEERAFRDYLCDSLYYQAQEKRLTVRFNDIIKPKKPQESAEEIILKTMEKGGLSFGERR